MHHLLALGNFDDRCGCRVDINQALWIFNSFSFFVDSNNIYFAFEQTRGQVRFVKVLALHECSALFCTFLSVYSQYYIFLVTFHLYNHSALIICNACFVSKPTCNKSL